MSRRDLSLDEQSNIRALMHLLRTSLGGNWTNVERVLPVSHSVRADITTGKREVSAAIAFRVAKALDVPLADALSGKALPPGTCKHCGRPGEG